MKLLNILGVNISILKKQNTLSEISGLLNNGKQNYVVTLNPEIILKAIHDEEYFYILNNADLSLTDGTGLKFAALAMGKNIDRITGADLTKLLLSYAEKENIKIGIFNWKNGLSASKEIKNVLKIKYPDLKFEVEDVDREWAMPYFQNFNIFQPEIVFINLGAPWQEKFIFHQLSKMPYVKLAIGVGGSFDFITGKIKRAPKFLHLLGIEWLWRLYKQPERWKRIFNAVIIFPYEFCKWRFIYPFLYRENVACLLYKKVGDKYKILLVERKDEPGHWQIPQGGTDGQGVEKAGFRELSEELNCNKFKPTASFKNLYSYKFGTRKEETNLRAQQSKRHTGFKGQKQGLFIAKFSGQDSDIRLNFWEYINWKWIDSDKLLSEVHPVRERAMKIFLEKFNQIKK